MDHSLSDTTLKARNGGSSGTAHTGIAGPAQHATGGQQSNGGQHSNGGQRESSSQGQVRQGKSETGANPRRHPTREEAEQAIRTLIRWAGDDPEREGLLETPKRVARAYEEFFAGYAVDPRQFLEKTFEESGGYRDMVLLRDIALHSHCEHHMVPIVGKVHLAYLPESRVVGISKLARVVEAFARRLQIQEKMTVEIAETIQEVLRPRGVAVIVEAAHQCMTTRGVKKADTVTVTRWMTGAFRENAELRQEFLQLIRD